MKIAIQLYSLRELCDEDFRGTLKMVAEAGYDGVELFSLYSHTPEEVRAMLDEFGLTAISTHHIGIDDWEQSFDRSLETAKTLGLRYSIMPCANLSTEDEWIDLAKRLDTIGAKLKNEGIRYGYHNHQQEFNLRYGDKNAMEILLAHADPQNVVWQMDVGLVHKCGVDPVALAEKYASRIPLIHARDLDENGGYCIETGNGVVDVAGVVEKLDEQAWLIVEHEVIKEKAFESIRTSADYLKETVRSLH